MIAEFTVFDSTFVVQQFFYWRDTQIFISFKHNSLHQSNYFNGSKQTNGYKICNENEVNNKFFQVVP